MHRSRPLVILLFLAAVARAAAEVPGGGLADVDCRVVFADVSATSGASGVTCVDGDPACDGDGAADGSCRFRVDICVGSRAKGCDTAPLSAIDVAGLPLPAPAGPDDGVCGAALDVVVPVDTASAATLLARQGSELRDVDYLNLCCVSGRDAATDARCALSVELSASGCARRRIPRRARTAFARARALFERAEAGHPGVIARAVGRLEVVREAGRRLASRDACGNALALVASHAAEAVHAAGAAAR